MERLPLKIDTAYMDPEAIEDAVMTGFSKPSDLADSTPGWMMVRWDRDLSSLFEGTTRLTPHDAGRRVGVMNHTPQPILAGMLLRWASRHRLVLHEGEGTETSWTLPQDQPRFLPRRSGFIDVRDPASRLGKLPLSSLVAREQKYRARKRQEQTRAIREKLMRLLELVPEDVPLPGSLIPATLPSSMTWAERTAASSKLLEGEPLWVHMECLWLVESFGRTVRERSTSMDEADLDVLAQMG